MSKYFTTYKRLSLSIDSVVYDFINGILDLDDSLDQTIQKHPNYCKDGNITKYGFCLLEKYKAKRSERDQATQTALQETSSALHKTKTELSQKESELSQALKEKEKLEKELAKAKQGK